METEWRVIPFAPSYAASDDGRVKRVARVKRGYSPGILTPWRCRDGYLYCTLMVEGKRANIAVHAAVAAAFIGPRPHGLDVCHNDGDGNNNAASNLRYGTRRENIADAIRHGRWNHGEKVPQSKLTDMNVIAIRVAVRSGVQAQNIGHTVRRRPNDNFKHCHADDVSATGHNLSDYRRPRLRVVSEREPLDYSEFDAAMAELFRAHAQVQKRLVEAWSLGYIKWPT